MPFRVLRYLPALALSAAACGGGRQSEPPNTALAATERSDAPPPLPQDPLQLLPAGATEILSIDLQRLRASPHYPVAEQWLRRFGCVQSEPDHFLLERTKRLVLASYRAAPGANPPQPLAILQGDYRDGDVERALAQARLWLGIQAAAGGSEQRGRFRVLRDGDLAGAQLGERLLALGHVERVHAALEVADARQPALDVAGEVMRGVHTEQWLDRHGAAAIAHVDQRTAERLGRQLSVIGGRRLGEDLTETSAALALVLAGDLELHAHVLYPDARTAADAASALRSVIGRADLVLRLTGMPSVLQHLQVNADGDRLDASLKLPAEEVRALSTRLEVVLQQSSPPCGTISAANEDARPRASFDSAQGAAPGQGR